MVRYYKGLLRLSCAGHYDRADIIQSSKIIYAIHGLLVERSNRTGNKTILNIFFSGEFRDPMYSFFSLALLGPLLKVDYTTL